MKKTYDIIDLLKWICSWFVVYIHMRPVLVDTPVLDAFIAQGITRIAVAFFFAVSMSFLFKKLKNSDDSKLTNRKILSRFVIHFFCLYIVWALIYYAYHIFYCWYNGVDYTYTPFGVILDFFARGVHYHLWYLIATLYALPVVYLLWRAGRIPLIATCLFLHILQCLDLPYHFGLLFDHPVVSFYQEEYDLIARTVLHAIPLMSLGVICQMDVRKYSNKTWGKLLIISLIVFFTELVILLLIQGEKMQMERSLSSIFLIYCLTNWAFTVEFQFPQKWIGRALRVSSFWIYCIHPLIRLLYHWIFAYDGVIRFVVVSFVTLASSFVYTAAKLYVDYRRELRSSNKANMLP